MEAEYVVCNWGGRLWPAKVLSRTGPSLKRKREVACRLEVQILSLDVKITVKSAETQMLTFSQMDAMTSSLVAGPKVRFLLGEERAHRRAMKMALDILAERVFSLGYSSTSQKEEPTTQSQRPPQKTSRVLPPKKPGKRPRGRPRSCGEKTEFSKFLVVSLMRCDSPSRGQSQRHTAIGPVPRETEPKPSTSSSVGHNIPSLSERGAGKKHKKKAAPSPVMSSHPMVMQQGACARQQESVLIWPPGTMRMRRKALTGKARDPRPKTQAISCASSAFSENIEGDIGGPSKPSSVGAAMSSSPADLRLAKRRRKRPVQGADGGPPERPPVRDSEATRLIRAKGKDGGHRGRRARTAFLQEPCPIEIGTLVWFKFQDYPYWPAMVTSVNRAEKTAKVLLIEAFMSEERRGIRVPLRRLKHFDCEEKPKFLKRARKLYGPSVDWCCSLVAHYRKGISSRSFVGSFLQYFTADISYPIRRPIQEGDMEGDFPRVNYYDLEESEEETSQGGKRPRKKLLPDRMKAARDRGNQKLLDFIVREKGAESHLLAIITGRKESTWLDSFLKSKKRLVCVETYLEDEDQLDVLVKYLQEIYSQIDEGLRRRIRNDQVNFLMEVLLPEVIIFSISALEGLCYKDAEAKYLRGPPVRYREKELFDHKILVERRRRLAKRKAN